MVKLPLIAAIMACLFAGVFMSSCSTQSSPADRLIVIGSAGGAALALMALTWAMAAAQYNLQRSMYAFPVLLLAALMTASSGSSLVRQGVLQGCKQPATFTYMLFAPAVVAGRWQCGCWGNVLAPLACPAASPAWAQCVAAPDDGAVQVSRLFSWRSSSAPTGWRYSPSRLQLGLLRSRTSQPTSSAMWGCWLPPWHLGAFAG